MQKSLKELSYLLERTGYRSFTERIINAAAKSNKSIALWRLPLQKDHTLIIDLEGYRYLDDIDLEELSGGFAMSPFLEKSKLWMNAHLTFNSGDNQLHADPLLSNELSEDLINLVNKATSLEFHGNINLHLPKDQKLDNPGAEYMALIKKGIEAIDRQQFQKVVPARTKIIKWPEDLSPLDVYFSLADRYSNAFVSLVSIHGIGTWIGASPELLIKVDQNSFFETASLAGTQKLKNDVKLSQVSWTQKEIEEQAMVSRYIINCFKKIRLREFEEHGPKTTIAGNLMHLKTTFRVDMNETSFPQLGSVMLKLLHPTSAVCGLPMEPAMEFLARNENLDREFFSGYLGPVNIFGESHIFVNLRCLQWLRDKAILYAGAGLTEDSDPEHELEETELKFRTLLDVINDIN